MYHLPFWDGNSIFEPSDCLTVDKNAAKTVAWSSENIFREWQAAEFSSPKDCPQEHQLLHSTTGTVCPKGLVESGSSDLPSLFLCGGLWTFSSHNTKQSKCSSTKLNRAMIQRDTAARIQMMIKKHLKWKETEDGRGCVFWGQTEKHWLKIAFIPDAELVQKTTGMKSMLEHTALIPLMAKTCGNMEEGFFQTKQPWWQWEGGRLTAPDRRRRK